MLKQNEFEAMVKIGLEEIRDLILGGRNEEAVKEIVVFRNCVEFMDRTIDVADLLESTAHENMVQETMEARIRSEVEAELKAKAEMEAKAKAEAEAKAKLEAEMAAKAAKEAEMKALAEANAKAEAEAKFEAELVAKLKSEAEKKAKDESEAAAKAAMEAKIRAKIEAEMKATTKSNTMPILEPLDLDFSKTPIGMKEMTEKEMIETEPVIAPRPLGEPEKNRSEEEPVPTKERLAKKLNNAFDKYFK